MFLNFLEQMEHSTMFCAGSGSSFVVGEDVEFVRWVITGCWGNCDVGLGCLGLGAVLTWIADSLHSLDSLRICSISWNCCVSVVSFVSFSFSRELIPVNTNFVPLILPSQLSEPSDLSSKSPLLAIELAGDTSLSSLLEE